MRPFLISMCDIFLILYLTAITNVKPAGDLTVDDFYKLKSMHETLKADKQKEEEALNEKLRREKEEKAVLLAEQQRREELAAAKLKDLAGEKETLAAKLDEEKDRIDEMKASLLTSDAERERMNQDLKEKEQILKAREQMLAELNDRIADQEEKWRKIQASYQEEVESQKQTIEETRVVTEQLADEARAARLLAEEIKAKARQEKEAKEAAERKATEALAAREEAEAEKQKALEVMETAQADTKRAVQSVRILSAAVKEIKQDADTAFENNIRSLMQTVDVTYEREIAGGATRYQRELTLMPVNFDQEIYVVFPSRQVGFSYRSDRAPDGLVITYQGQKVTKGLINKDDDLIAIALPGYEDEVYAPYPAAAQLTEFMPTLLALRNNGSVSLLDKVRGISDSYFIVNRDYLKADTGRGFEYDVTGFPGTGTRAERIIAGDQLVDLNGKLIGVANQANRVIRINTMPQWDTITF